MPSKTDIEAEIGRRLTDCKSIRDEAVKSHAGMIPGDQMEAVNEHIAQIKSLRDQLKSQSEVDAFLSGGIGGVQSAAQEEKAAEGYDSDGRLMWDGSKKLSEMVTESKQYREMLAKHSRGGHISSEARVAMERVNFAPKGKRSQKDFTVTGASVTSAGSLVWPQFEGLSPYWSSYQRPLLVRSLFSQGTTETDTIDYTRITSVTNNAASRAEATVGDAPVLPGAFAAGGALVNVTGGGYAAQSGMVFERDVVNVQDFAHWIPVTKRALADAGQIQSQIDIFLGYGLEATLENQFLTGNGTSPNLAGLNATSGLQTLDQTASASSDAFISTRKARTLIKINAHCDPTAYLVHPSDWEGVDLRRTGVYNGTTSVQGGGYLGAGPFEETQPRLWGLPVVQSEAVTVGQAWVGAWNRAVVFDRQQASVQMTDQHADYFIRGLVAILAEERLAFAVLHPQAFLKITNFVTTTGL